MSAARQRSLRLRAPAKLNLGLRVLGRRPDGYHEIDSVFVPLDLADELEIGVSEPCGDRSGVSLALAGEATGVPAGPENLARRAARAFLEEAGVQARVELRLRKWIPAAAGLGGGSSDAAAVLRGLAALLPDRVSSEGLRALALSLGADVPYFLDPRPARVRGIGERIDALGEMEPVPVLLAHPGAGLATAEVYACYDALQPAPAPARGAVLPGLPGPGLHNDLAAAAERLCPEIARLREALLAAGPRGVGLSGSGPTLFAVFPSRQEALAAATRLPAGRWCRVAWAGRPA